jgi:hypothetical protein
VCNVQAIADIIQIPGKWQEAKQQAAVSKSNQYLAQYNAQSERRVGEDESQAVYRQRAQIVGEQRSRHGASDLGLASGTPLELGEDTARQAEMDAVTARNNAARRAWGFEVEAAQHKFAAKAYKDSAKYLGLKPILKGFQGRFS